MISRRDLIKAFGGLMASLNLPAVWLDSPVEEEQETPVVEDKYKVYMFKGKHSGRRKIELPDGYELFQVSFTGKSVTRSSLLGTTGPLLQFACGPSQYLTWMSTPDCAIIAPSMSVQMLVEDGKEWEFGAVARRYK